MSSQFLLFSRNNTFNAWLKDLLLAWMTRFRSSRDTFCLFFEIGKKSANQSKASSLVSKKFKDSDWYSEKIHSINKRLVNKFCFSFSDESSSRAPLIMVVLLPYPSKGVWSSCQRSEWKCFYFPRDSREESSLQRSFRLGHCSGRTWKKYSAASARVNRFSHFDSLWWWTPRDKQASWPFHYIFEGQTHSM